MNPFLVLVTRHRKFDEFTTQIDVYVEEADKFSARKLVRTNYPPLYIKFWEDGVCLGIVAHFTGEVISLHE